MRTAPIPGYPYHVSDYGHVTSNRDGRVLKPLDNGNGYLGVALFPADGSGGNSGHRIYIHQLVLRAFVGPCPEGHNVNHINGDKGDNRLANLEYVTYSENHHHSRKVLGRTVGESHGCAKLMRQEVLFIRDCYEAGGVYQRELAEEFGVTAAAIQNVCSGKSWSHL